MDAVVECEVKTSLLFTLGKFAIGLYLGNASFTSAYGAAGATVSGGRRRARRH